jgi:DNA replication protein DnaC
MSNPAVAAVTREPCRELKLGAVVRESPALCRRAQDRGRPYEEFWPELLEAAVINRRQSTARRLLREARLPAVKTLAQVDWPALKGVAKPKILELASCQFITSAERLSVARPIGTRKTLLAIALGWKPPGAVPACSSSAPPIWCRTCSRRATNAPSPACSSATNGVSRPQTQTRR